MRSGLGILEPVYLRLVERHNRELAVINSELNPGGSFLSHALQVSGRLLTG